MAACDLEIRQTLVYDLGQVYSIDMYIGCLTRIPTSLVTQHYMYFLGYFQVKAMKFQVNLAVNHSVYVDNVDMTKHE